MSNLLLSEYMRLGAMLRPQAFGCLFDGVGTCANGAALEAMGWKPNRDSLDAWDAREDLVPILQTVAIDPIGGYPTYVGLIIVDLNNIHRWTRERIADWVESIERERGLIPAADAPALSVTLGPAEAAELVAYVEGEAEPELERLRR